MSDHAAPGQGVVNRMDLSVLVVYYKGRSFIRTCIATAQRELSRTGLAFEILVCDNECTVESAQLLRDLAREYRCRVLSVGRNVGFGAGNNILARHASGKHLFLLNQDAYVEHIGEGLKRALELELQILVPCLKNPDGSPQAQFFHYPSIPSIAAEAFFLKDLVAGLSHVRASQRLRSLWAAARPRARLLSSCYPSGAAVIVAKDLLLSQGGFEEEIFLYHEECLLFAHLRSRDSRLRVTQLADFHVVHHGGSGTPLVHDRLGLYYCNLLYVYRKLMRGRRLCQQRVRVYTILVLILLRLRALLWRAGVRVDPSARAYMLPRGTAALDRAGVVHSIDEAITLVRKSGP